MQQRKGRKKNEESSEKRGEANNGEGRKLLNENGNERQLIK